MVSTISSCVTHRQSFGGGENIIGVPGSVKVVINRYFKYSKNKTQRRIMKNEFESSIQ